MKKYDYILVGCGLYNASLAYFLTKHNKKVLILEKRDHIAGNIYTKNIDNINVHVYGAHIFHTSNVDVWNFVNKFSSFNNFINEPLGLYKGKYYHLPYNLNTFKDLWGDNITKEEAKKIIEEEINKENIKEIKNLEDQALSLVGRTIYETLIKGYTEKQWGRSCKDLPSFIIKRIPLRFEANNNYFNDSYQGIPKCGYTKFVENMLKGIEVKLNVDYLKDKEYYDSLADFIVYSGAIDEYFNYKFGELEYRSLRFENETLDLESYQPRAVINYEEKEVPYTRIIEHKKFLNDESKKTIITKEYPSTYKRGDERYYPINDEKNNTLYSKYLEEVKKIDNLILGGRLGKYKYFDMDDTILEAMNDAKKILKLDLL